MSVFLFYLLLGAVAGTVGGLFGVGGGVVVVPALIFAFSGQGVSPEVLTHMAVATSLAAMVVTSSSSAWAHYRHAHIDWAVLKWLAIGVIFGAFFGVAGSLQMQGEWIQIAFGIFLLFVGGRVLLKGQPPAGRVMPSSPIVSLVGTVIGGVSMVFGIGGGSMTVPFLLRYQLPSQMAVGTSAALGVPIAVLGGLLYAVNESVDGMMPDQSVGYVYLPAFFGMAAAGIPFARLGANIAKQLPEQRLKKAFALFALFMAMILLLRNLG